MNSILIDYDSIINNKLHGNLIKKIDQAPNTKLQIGLVLIIPKNQLDKLDGLEKGKEKVNYLNDPSFVKSIKAYNYISCNKNTCRILEPKVKFINLILESIQNNFSNILVIIPLKAKKIIKKICRI